MKAFIALVLLALRSGGTFAQEACDAACQAAFERSLQSESASWVSQNATLEDFYSTPDNSSTAKPGDVLRWESIPRATVNTNYSIPAGTSLHRFLYMTEDIDRKPIPASAFVLLPYSNVDPTKPFNTLVLYYEWQGPFALAMAGYAVVAPDYAGQGSDIPQGFMYEAGYLHAADAAYSLIAARKVIGNLLSEEWMVIGHSEGGLTAWRTNERLAMADQEELLKAGTFLGAVAEAPALRPLDLIPESIRIANGGPLGDAVSVYFLQSLSRLFPDDIRIEEYVTDIVLGRIGLADQSCLQGGRALFGNLTKDELFKDMSWLEHPAVVDWQKRYNGAGPHALAAPMLVIQGLADILTYANNTRLDFNRTCSSFPESSAELRLYPEADHDVVTQAAQVDYLDWIRARFAHEETDPGCETTTVEPASTQFRNVGTYYVGSSG
ncbi:hypothetical protein BS50DRAFT_595373 [Corynespora cassiicola Philippines]|uniref:Uncharacterized protein n=1 Tax=Corynespora cassiicola Philippines TaxID=1448308 RepID=A0A2T2P830_CORCC|nr:hypothetical protein BS50DRAFT_595373 [Corynespora cassiicola Philippines]